MDCPRLQQLDVSSNKLELFPSTLVGSKLKEFHYESNPLLPYIPVAAEQHEEVLKLKVPVLSFSFQQLLEHTLSAGDHFKTTD